MCRLHFSLIFLLMLLTQSMLMAGTHLVYWGGGIDFDGRKFNKPLTQVCVGQEHAVGLKEDGTVVAWGKSAYGRTAVPAGLAGVKYIAAGSIHTVALKNDGTVVAWGDNTYGQTDVPAGLINVKAIAAGGNHTVALKNDGTLVAWGLNSSNQVDIPVGLSAVKAIAAGESHTVALLTNGTVVGWGSSSNDQLPVPATALSGVNAISAGTYHTVALKTNGTVVAWGLNSSSQATVPSGLNGVKSVAAGTYHTVALKNDGNVVTWGSNESGQKLVPAGLTGVSAIAAGYATTLALKVDGTLVGWGIHYTGQSNDVKAIAGGSALKDDGTVVAWGEGSPPPAGLSGVSSIASGPEKYHTLALKSNGAVVAWGYNGEGQATVPPGLNGVKAIAAGDYHSVALLTNGAVVAWGSNGNGQANVPPSALSDVQSVAAGSTHTVALKTDGTVLAWGANDYGQTTMPAGLSDVKAIAAGYHHTVALKTDGTVVTWGSNDYGEMDVPSGLNGVKAISAAYFHTAALKNDGTMVAWGYNELGQTNVPTDLSGVSSIQTGFDHTIAFINSAANGTGPAKVRIISGDFFAVVGQSHTLIAIADGAVPLTYQWRKDGVAISKATSSTLILTNLQRTQAGVYDVVVKNTQGVALSNSVRLSFAPLITVLTSPQTRIVNPGGTAFFNVWVPGATAWQWLKNGTPIKGAITSTLNVPNVDASSAGLYSVAVTTPNGKVTTAPAQLRVNDSGLLIYKLTGTGKAYEGSVATNAVLSGYLILDRAGQRSGLIIGSKSGSQNIHRLEIHDDLDTQSTGPVPKSQTVVSELVAGEFALWMDGTDSLLTISKTDKAVGPATMKGYANSIDLGSNVRIETVSLTLTLDAVNSTPARLSQETVQQAMLRISQDMQAKGSALVE